MEKQLFLLEAAFRTFIYDPDSGILMRKKNMKIVGSADDRGYLRVSLCNTRLKVHRLAWAMHFGKFPSKEIDHINGAKGDNRICNLRDVDSFTNQQNKKVARVDNKTGFLGVSPNNSKFIARIRINGKDTYLGSFESPQLAHKAYVIAKRTFHKGGTL